MLNRVLHLVRRIARMLDMRFTHVAAWLAISNYVQAAAGFAINILLARTLGSDLFGVYSLGLVIASFVVATAGLGSDRTLVRDIVQDGDGRRLFTASNILRAGAGLLALLVASSYLGACGYPERQFWPLWLLVLSGVLLNMSPVAWLDSQMKMHLHALIAAAEKILYGFVVIWVLRSDASPYVALRNVALGLVIVRIFSIAGQWHLVRRTYKPEFTGILACARRLLSDSWMMVGAGLCSMLYTHFNQVVLEQSGGFAVLGGYSVAFQLIAVVQLFQAQIVRVWDPGIAAMLADSRNERHIKRELLSGVRSSTIGTLAIAGPLFVFAPVVVRIFFHGGYESAVLPLRILCIWSFIYGPSLVINRYLINLHLHREYFYITLIAGLLGLAWGIVLVPSQGGLGVALSLCLSHPVSTLLQLRAVLRRIGRDASGVH